MGSVNGEVVDVLVSLSKTNGMWSVRVDAHSTGTKGFKSGARRYRGLTMAEAIDAVSSELEGFDPAQGQMFRD